MPSTIGSSPAMWFEAITAAPRGIAVLAVDAQAHHRREPRLDDHARELPHVLRRQEPEVVARRACAHAVAPRTSRASSVTTASTDSRDVSTRTASCATLRLRAVAAVALQRVRRAAAAGADLGRGVEPHLQLGLRPHDLADVAALGDGVAVGRGTPAAPRASPRARTAACATSETAASTSGRPQARVALVRAPGARARGLGRIGAVEQHAQRHGPVHRAGVEVAVADPLARGGGRRWTCRRRRGRRW